MGFKKCLLFLFVFILLLAGNACAQKRNNIWAFGDGAGLNFNTAPVKGFTSKVPGIKPPYFISSICDKEGNLLFYTDGIKVWNSYNKELPKYKNWWPWSDNVMPLVCPYPGNDSLYYIFGISNGLNAHKLLYITTKMYQSGDVEEVVYPTPASQTAYYHQLADDAAQLLAGTHHCNGKDVWITTYTPGVLQSFLISHSGIAPTPVATSVAATLIPAKKIEGKNSNLKFSANGEKLVVPVIEENKIVVFDFENSSGIFSNPIKLSLAEGLTLEDVELSPDGSKLYVGAFSVDAESGAELHYVTQYNLDAGTAAQIETSAYRLNGFGDRVACVRSCFMLHRTLTLGPDGRIYVSMREAGHVALDKTISVIEEPNNPGRDCRYRADAVNIGRMYKFINYNYIRSESFSLQENGIQVQKKTCADKPVSFSLLFSKVDSVQWNFGDAASADRNISTALAPQHQYPAPGTYGVKAIIYNNCLTDTAFKEVVIENTPSVKVPAGIKDTVVCVGGELQLDATAPFAKYYTWDNGLIYAKRYITEAGHYFVTVANDCSIDSKDFVVVQQKCDCSVFTPSAFTPNNDGLNDVFKPSVKCFVKEFDLKIFSRFGDVVFQTANAQTGWDGTLKKMEAPTGVYVWMLQYQNPNTKAFYRQQGTVLLIR